MTDRSNSLHPAPGRWCIVLLALLVAAGAGLCRGAGMDQSVMTAAGHGDPPAQYRLGIAYLQALGEDRQIQEGIKWIVAAAQSGHVPARTCLAELYTWGLVVPYEPKTAFDLLLEAAVENHHAAAYGVAQCFRKGIGVSSNPAKAEEWFARAVHVDAASEDALDGESLRTIGLCYRDGDGVPKSYPAAARWFLKASQAGSPRALFELANFYAFGLGVSQDDRKAFALYLRAAYAGSARACLAVSRRYRDGKGIAADPAETEAWSDRAVNQLTEEASLGSVDAATELYRVLSRGVLDRDPQRGLPWLTRAVEAAYPPALTLYGEALANGAGVPQDLPEAIRVLERAADANEGGAHYLLFQLYLGKNELPPDPGRAGAHLLAAAEAGNVTAMGKLANWYAAHPERPEAASRAETWRIRALEANLVLAERGQVQAQLALVSLYGRGGGGVPRDDTKALFWLEQAAENGWDEAQYSLANACEKGLGVPRDPAQALRWYQAAAEQDFAPAMLNLAAIYERGELGVDPNPVAAARWYDQAFAIAEAAAQAGDRDAAYLVATFYREGLGRPRNTSQHLHWLHRAAELGDSQACLQLSSMYSAGRSVARNPDEAFRLIRQAADQGDPEGRFLLGRLNDEGNYVARDFPRAYELYYLAAQQGYRPARILQEEMEITLDPGLTRRIRAQADAALRTERLAAGDLGALDMTN